MVHSFMHNPNAKVVVKDGAARTLAVHNSPIKMDLNGEADIKNSVALNTIIGEWSSMKNSFLRSYKDSVKVSEYPNFFKHIFGNNTANVDVEYVTTAKLFDESINSPILLHSNSTQGALKTGDLLRTLSVKLTVGTGKNQKVHYVTLGAFPSIYTLKNKGLLGLEDADVHGPKILSDYSAANAEIMARLNALKKEGKQMFLETGKVSDSDIEIITSTLLRGSDKVSHSLMTLPYKFPGMNISEIRIFPNEKTEFAKVINNYTYGEQRTPEQIETLRTGIKVVNGVETQAHEPYSGKPYIVVSYANDIDGKSGNNTSARLLPITAKSRDIKTLREEIKTINAEISNLYRSRKKGEDVKISDSINAKQETLLDRNQILDILIEWGNKIHGDGTMLDLLTQEVKIGDSDVTMMDVFSKFRTEKGGSLSLTSQAFLDVVEIVKKYTNENYVPDNAEEGELGSKDRIINEISGIVGWA